MTGNLHTGQGSPPSQATLPNNPASPPSKRDLKSWWRTFKLPTKHQETSQQANEASSEHRGPGIFGVPLRQSITYANVAISLVDENGQSYIYGYVPIVVAKCGVFLKEKATGIEGIFRLSGSEKRIKELKTIFDSPDRYGKGLVWDGYTVHDAANVLRRYLNDLPEPVVPLDLYEKFRYPLRGATKQAVGDAEGPQFVENFNEMAAIETYQTLITELPPLNKQLLLYILDLLAVFAAKSDENRMNSQNLAAIFQPGMLSHPQHAMAPEEYRLNQCVIIFLIENQDHFLIGMQGTAADEKTMKEVALGSPNGSYTPNPNRSSGGLGRTASNASAGAESVRREGKLRRNRSVSSKHSRADGSVTPNSPAVATTPTGGLGRSNTVPSKKSPALVGGKFNKHDNSGRTPHSPALEPLTQAHPYEENPSSAAIPSPAHGTYDATHLSVEHGTPSGRSQERLLDVPHVLSTPTKDRNLPNNLQNLFQRSPNNEGVDRRQPNKLKKKRIPGSVNISAQSSVASLPHTASNAPSPGAEIANPLETAVHPVVHPFVQPVFLPSAAPHPIHESTPQPPNHQLEPQQQTEHRQQQQQQHQPQETHQHDDTTNEGTPRNSEFHPNHSTLRPDDSARGKKSPPASLHSSFNDGSDFDHVTTNDLPGPGQQEGSDKERKSRWRISRSRKDDYAGFSGSPAVSPPRLNLGSNNNADVSTTSIGSSLAKPRKSFTGDSTEQLGGNGDRYISYGSGGDSFKDEGKGPIGWIRNKYREAKENAEQRRNKSPPPHDHHHALSATLLAPRGKSLDIKREGYREEDKPGTKPAQPQVEPLHGFPPVPDASNQENQPDTTQKQPVQGMTIQRVISQTDESIIPTERAEHAATETDSTEAAQTHNPPPETIPNETSTAVPPQNPAPQNHPEKQQPLPPVVENQQLEQELEQEPVPQADIPKQ